MPVESVHQLCLRSTDGWVAHLGFSQRSNINNPAIDRKSWDPEPRSTRGPKPHPAASPKINWLHYVPSGN